MYTQDQGTEYRPAFLLRKPGGVQDIKKQ